VRLWRALGTVSHVEGYTRTRESSEPRIIDLIFTNEDDMVDRIVHEHRFKMADIESGSNIVDLQHVFCTFND
jgi:hypothetical protein